MRNKRRLEIGAWSLVVACRLFALLHRYYDTDELEHLHAAWCTAHGQLIYKDFFEHHGPLLAIGCAPWVSQMESPAHAMQVGRLAMLVLWLAIIGFACRLVESSWKRWSAWGVILFLWTFSTFSIKALEFRPDVPAVCLLVLCLWMSRHRLDMKRAFALGLSGAVATLFTPKAIYPLAGAAVFVAWDHRFDRPVDLLKLASMLMIGFVAPWALVLAYFKFHGGLSALINCLWSFNIHFRGTFPLWPFIKDSVTWNPAIWILTVMGLVFVPGSGALRGALLGWLVGLWRLPVAYPQYYLFVAPVLAYWAVAGLNEAWKKVPRGMPQRIMVGVVVLGMAPGILAQEADFKLTNKPQVEEISCVMRLTTRQDKIFDAWTGVPVFRPHAWYFWFLHDEIRLMIEPRKMEDGILRALADPGCRALIWGEYFSTLSPRVLRYAREHFRPAGCGRLFVKITGGAD